MPALPAFFPFVVVVVVVSLGSNKMCSPRVTEKEVFFKRSKLGVKSLAGVVCRWRTGG
jgi:hypothetical protein